MISHITSAAILGFEAQPIDIEIDISKGEYKAVVLVGLPDAAVRESRDRVKSAMLNSDFDFPIEKVTINLAPADVRKEGPLYDLPIAVGILEASGQIPPGSTEGTALLGEMSLDGRLRPVKGCLVAVQGLQKRGIEKIILPAANTREAALAREVEIFPASTLKDVVFHLRGEKTLAPLSYEEDDSMTSVSLGPDFADVIGQTQAKRALTIAAAGNHNLLMVGPPGSGKTMLARRLPSIMPPLDLEEKIEVTSLHSLAGQLDSVDDLIKKRPFRAPHHTTSDVGLIGGGSYPRPGEISLSHRGVLFLDELPEFSRRSLEVLRQPLEEGIIRICRARATAVFPAKILFLGAMNPCPCGYSTHPEKNCRCSPRKVQRYISRISGPLLDRIDLQVEVQRIPFESLLEKSSQPLSSEELSKEVKKARKVQRERLKGEEIETNGDMNHRQVKRYCQCTAEARRLFRSAYRHQNLSGRSYHRILKVARTVADFEGSQPIKGEHLAEVMHLRNLEKLFV